MRNHILKNSPLKKNPPHPRISPVFKIPKTMTIRMNQYNISLKIVMIEQHDYAFKLIIVGNQGVGKSSLFLRYCDNNFADNYLPTIGVDFRFKKHTVDDITCKLQIWDTAGQERFRTITSSYYRSSQAVLIVFDLSDPLSLTEIENYWLREAKNNTGPGTVYCIVGNKSDMSWKVTKKQVESLNKDHSVLTYYLSSKTGEGVQEMFNDLCHKLIQISKQKQSKNKKKRKLRILQAEEEVSKKRCC